MSKSTSLQLGNVQEVVEEIYQLGAKMEVAKTKATRDLIDIVTLLEAEMDRQRDVDTEYVAALGDLNGAIVAVIAVSAAELRDGRLSAIVRSVTQLQFRYKPNWALAGRALITRSLLVFSRLTRLLEHMNFDRNEYNALLFMQSKNVRKQHNARLALAKGLEAPASALEVPLSPAGLLLSGPPSAGTDVSATALPLHLTVESAGVNSPLSRSVDGASPGNLISPSRPSRPSRSRCSEATTRSTRRSRRRRPRRAARCSSRPRGTRSSRRRARARRSRGRTLSAWRACTATWWRAGRPRARGLTACAGARWTRRR